jgi:hypothetical protein
VGRGEDLRDRFFFKFHLKIALKALARRNFSSLSSIALSRPVSQKRLKIFE